MVGVAGKVAPSILKSKSEVLQLQLPRFFKFIPQS
jgi:hypothetical protein